MNIFKKIENNKMENESDKIRSKQISLYFRKFSFDKI